MKITYAENPMATKVELDEHEREVFRLKLKLKEYEDMIFTAHFHLSDNKYFSLEEARKDLDPEYWCVDGRSKLDDRVDELLEHYLAELTSYHCGDCTCFAMSCSKCAAESRLGIDTIKGLGKHPGHYIDSVFRDKNVVTVEQAIEQLKANTPKVTWEGSEPHVARWITEHEDAIRWLEGYRLFLRSQPKES